MFCDDRIASRIASRIARWLVAAAMDFAVDLYGKARSEAGEIEAVMVERVLFAKAQSVRSRAEGAP